MLTNFIRSGTWPGLGLGGLKAQKCSGHPAIMGTPSRYSERLGEGSNSDDPLEPRHPTMPEGCSIVELLTGPSGSFCCL